jgi:hypothetical protein
LMEHRKVQNGKKKGTIKKKKKKNGANIITVTLREIVRFVGLWSHEERHQ